MEQSAFDQSGVGMRRIMSSRFDRVAELYDSSLSPLPEEYCQLIQERFVSSENDRIIDLGCGSGLLTFILSRFSNHIEGIDISKKLIKIARSRDRKKRIKWVCNAVENFDFGCNKYSLIISCESFHLFPNIDELVEKCARGLKLNGFLCIAWYSYEWEEQLKDIIIDIFKSFGIEWGEWGYQRCGDFSLAVKRNEKHLSPVVEETIGVQAKTHIGVIASYLASIDKAATLEIHARIDLIKELENNFRSVLSSEWSSGLASYSLTYSRKYNL